MEIKKKIMVDMDGVLCDFSGAARAAITDNPDQKYPQSRWGFFLKLPPIKDAINSFNMLSKQYDMWILTRPSFQNVNCYTEKAQWIWDHLGYDIVRKTIMAPDKSMVLGDFLIDDMTNAGQPNFPGEFVHFGSEKFPDWVAIRIYLLNKV